jgi:transcription-repair coupling factor (superfamily II helicase)
MKEIFDTPIAVAEHLVELYENTENVIFLSEKLAQSDPHLFLKGTSGSQAALIAAALHSRKPRPSLFILNDKDTASYFWNDLQNLLPSVEVFFFPNSYKKPYAFTEIENANIIQRSEVLSKISADKNAPHLVVSYPEALFEKVINQRSLVSNTLILRRGDELDYSFLTDVLNDYDFNKEDYVYEGGMFAIRGGIIDIFSFSNELPYRIELDGSKIESIRLFDPITQLSVRELEFCSITPNTQTKLLQEVRESFLRFISPKSLLWIKDFNLAKEVVDRYFLTAKQTFSEILKLSGQTQVISEPEQLFETGDNFESQISQFGIVEFGTKVTAPQKSGRPLTVLELKSESQPSFDKDFNLFASELDKNQLYDYRSILVADSQLQLNRLKNILNEINPKLKDFSEVMISLSGGFKDHDLKIALYTDHQLFERFHRYYQRKKYTKSKALTLKELHELQVGDYVTHIDYGIGRFAGMEKIQIKGKEQEAMRLVYKDSDVLYVSIHSLHKICKYSGQEGKQPSVSKLGSQEWEQKKSRAKRKLKDIAEELIKLYAKRRIAPGFAYQEDDYLMAELESSFIYEETPDQSSAIEAVKKDMAKSYPMDRLVCGDVGFGKTEVAIRAAFKAVTNGKQVAVLVPTTILAFQHFRTFSERLRKLPCKVEYISRFRSDKEIKGVLKELAEGKVDIVIGTHRLISKDVVFKNLGLMIVDEEQKFGVKAKEAFKEMKLNVDAITLTATPIPRTLQLSLMGARDLSVIATPPPNRQPITTELHVYSEKLIRDAVMHELVRGGQTFFVHNRIDELESIANIILKLVPDARVAFAHGQMDGEVLEKIMLKFMEGYYDVLVSTNIIESGLDIPNANTIIINKAHYFGLSDLHQMRGRVGRSNRKAYCYLLIPSLTLITPDARKKLAAMEEFSELGDGFKIAMRDLDIRGAGNLLGGEQSGFISDLGFDVYIKMLEEAVSELKENEFREIFADENGPAKEPSLSLDCVLETDLQILIPDHYVSNTSERLSLYIQIDSLKNEAELQKLQNELKDKYGPLPEAVLELFEIVRLRWKAQSLGIEKLVLKNETMKTHFPDSSKTDYYKSDIFGKVVNYVARNQKFSRMAETKGRAVVTFSEVLSVVDAKKIIDNMLN